LSQRQIRPWRHATTDATTDENSMAPPTNKGKNKGMSEKARWERDIKAEIDAHKAVERRVGRKKLDAWWDPECLKSVNRYIAKEKQAEARKQARKQAWKKRFAGNKH